MLLPNPTSSRRLLGGWGELFELAAELLLGAHLELPRTLAADAELAAERRERDGIVAQNPLLDDEPLSLVEHRKRIGETFPNPTIASLALDDDVLPFARTGQQLDECRIGIVVGRCIQRDLTLVEAAKQLGHFFNGRIEL